MEAKIEGKYLDLSNVDGEKTFEQRIAKLEAKIDEQSKRLDDLLLRVWMAGEENGRKHLSQFGDLDIEGSERDFKQWINKEKIL